jgi:CubicO group peptidase (beta-lactamase class C family)
MAIIDMMRRAAADFVGLDQIPGLAYALVEDGAVAAEEAIGSAALAPARKLSAGHVFQAASLGKPITAWAILRLAEAGRIALDAPLRQYLNPWPLPPSSWPAHLVTIRHVLSHTAGLSLPDYPGFEPNRTLPSLAESIAGNTNGGGALTIKACPGERFRYSGGGYTLLQMLLEQQSGESFATYMTREILGPLRMHSSTFDQEPVARAAAGHDRDGRELPFYIFDGAAAAGLRATAGDLAKFLAAHMTDAAGAAPGRGLISPASIAAMTAPHAQTGRADGLWGFYGLGFEIEHTADGRDVVGHHGMNRGWRALMAADLAARRGLVVLANSDRAAPAIERLFQLWLGS